MKTKTKQNNKRKATLFDLIVYWVVRLVIICISIFPYKLRIQFGGWFFQSILSPLSGNKTRINNNLDHVLPQLDVNEKQQLFKSIPNNIGRTMFELLLPKDFSKHAQNAPILGSGVSALEQANHDGRPVVLVSGHFGNYDVVRAKLKARGINVGALYKPMNNPYFNQFYEKSIMSIAQPLFPRGRSGMTDMMRYLKNGNVVALLIDQHMQHGEPLKFFDKTAYTATSAAKMALKYDALLLTFYVVRQSDGVSFELFIEDPIEPSNATDMTQIMNDRLEIQVRKNMDQWLWTHRRWKLPPHIKDN